ncbi:MAG: adenine deaminase C-terminal domain-containing protein [Spirochaetota bacterium]|nr:adenine deaminase C-terminal domain-containing protein [Spirochaetota bacterium]
MILNSRALLSSKAEKIIFVSITSSIQKSLGALGIDHVNPIMSMCTLTLPVSPELKITDKGLIDVRKSKVVPLFAE